MKEQSNHARWGANGAGTTHDPIQDPESMLTEDPALARALDDFRRSVQAWSDAAYVRPRSVAGTAAGRTWRKAVAWGLGCVLTVATAGGALVEHQHRKELARIAAQREAQKQMAAKRAQDTEDLLARVDSDVSREVPDAMEPLASLMTDSDSQ